MECVFVGIKRVCWCLLEAVFRSEDRQSTTVMLASVSSHTGGGWVQRQPPPRSHHESVSALCCWLTAPIGLTLYHEKCHRVPVPSSLSLSDSLCFYLSLPHIYDCCFSLSSLPLYPLCQLLLHKKPSQRRATQYEWRGGELHSER